MNFDSITAEVIKDSRDEDTIKINVSCDIGKFSASVPSGESVSDKAMKLKTPTEALKLVKAVIAPRLLGGRFDSQRELDSFLLELDSTSDKSNLGANTILGISIAGARALAKEANKKLWEYVASENNFTAQLPRILANVIEGGVHANWGTPIQEHMTVMNNEHIDKEYENVKSIMSILQDKFKESMGDEGGIAPKFSNIKEPFEIIRGITDRPIVIDAAGSEFYKNGKYEFFDNSYTNKELIEIYENLASNYNVVAIEDPFDENDIGGFTELTKKLGSKLAIVGDDLTATNPNLLKEFIKEKVANGVIIKPNQIGTLTEVYEAVRIAHNAGWKCIASHRSGETEDNFISDLAVGIGAWGIKIGSPTQKERITKYERLVEIEKEIVR